MEPRRLLIVFHSQSGSAQRLAEAVIRGARRTEGVTVRDVRALDATLDDLLWAEAVIFGTPENFGYMSGALKDFFDRTFYPAQGKVSQLPYALFVKAGNDGTGAVTSVERIARDGEGWRLELRGGLVARAAKVVVAAAWDTPALLSPLGVELPIEREPKYLFYSDPIRERLLEPLVIAPERHFAAKQLADGSVLASDLGAGGAERPGENREIWHSNVRRAITELLPILEYVSFPVLVEGFYDVTPDRQPVLGPLDGHDGLLVAAGLNGRGLMMAPTIGRVIADGVVNGRMEPEMAPLAASRFADGTLTPELQVV